jgi:hypothetical protein
MKKDDGIAKLKNGILIPESVRDELLKHNWQERRNTQAGYNPNTATTKELEQHGFSGFRVNVFTNDVELWCLGRIGTRRNMGDVERNPSVLASMHEEVFATSGTVIEIPMQIKKGKRKKR